MADPLCHRSAVSAKSREYFWRVAAQLGSCCQQGIVAKCQHVPQRFGCRAIRRSSSLARFWPNDLRKWVRHRSRSRGRPPSQGVLSAHSTENQDQTTRQDVGGKPCDAAGECLLRRLRRCSHRGSCRGVGARGDVSGFHRLVSHASQTIRGFRRRRGEQGRLRVARADLDRLPAGRSWGEVPPFRPGSPRGDAV